MSCPARESAEAAIGRAEALLRHHVAQGRPVFVWRNPTPMFLTGADGSRKGWPVEAMRTHFEGVIKGTPAFAANTPLGTITINDSFSHYANPDTDMMWLGFAMGMRCAERIEKAKAAQP